MTPDERKQAALSEVSAALKKYGCELTTQWRVEQLGDALQARPQIIVKANADWTPPTPDPAEMPANVDTDSPE